MLLAEALGREAFRERVKIYATDVDEQALTQARAGRATPAQQVEGVPAELRREIFRAATATGMCSDKDLRRSVIFGRHDLVQDAPISRVDLLVCRNTLMYFNTEAQARILAALPFRAGRRWRPVPRQGRDAVHAHGAVHADRSASSRMFTQGAEDQLARSPGR